MEAIIELENVNKYFLEPQKFHVLKDIQLTISKGQFTSIVGTSGSGKSTLLYVMSTMDTDYEGILRINGENLTEKNNDYAAKFRNKHIGFIFQFHFLLPEFTALQNIMLPALKLGELSKSEIEHNAYDLLDKVGLKDHALKNANKLSGGQQQRVAISRALINKPAIVIGDEPTGNLDSKNSRMVLDIFKGLVEEYGQTLVTVTHDKEFASETNTIIEMEDGRVIRS